MIKHSWSNSGVKCVLGILVVDFCVDVSVSVSYMFVYTLKTLFFPSPIMFFKPNSYFSLTKYIKIKE